MILMHKLRFSDRASSIVFACTRGCTGLTAVLYQFLQNQLRVAPQAWAALAGEGVAPPFLGDVDGADWAQFRADGSLNVGLVYFVALGLACVAVWVALTVRTASRRVFFAHASPSYAHVCCAGPRLRCAVWVMLTVRTVAGLTRGPSSGAALPLLTKDKGGHAAPSPYLSIIARTGATMLKAGSEIGFSPAARPRIAVAMKVDSVTPTSPWSEFEVIEGGKKTG